MFFNPLNVDPNYKVLATAQLTMTDETDASNLAGNMTIVNGSRSQAYLTGSNQPYNPDWKTSNLVLRPYMIATSIYRGSSDTRYNPDLFDPKEYPNLEAPGDIGITKPYIQDIAWYIVDSANNQTLIDIEKNPGQAKQFSHTWTYTTGLESSVMLNDKRTLVIKDNILEKDQIKNIMVKFSFHDPFADIRIPVVYDIQITNLSTGMGVSKAFINAVDGNSFYNAGETEQLRLEAQYFNEGTKVDLDQELSQGHSNMKIEWFMKTERGWTVLDPTTQDSNQWSKFYEIHTVTQRDLQGNIQNTQKTTNAKGGTVLIVRPGLVAGSEIFKLTITDDTLSDQQQSALETIYDYSDPTQCYIHSSNGDKLYKGMDTPGTVLSAVVTYKGELFNNDDDRYNTMFDYYWYRIDALGDKIENIYFDDSTIKFKNVKDPDYKPESGFPKKSKRSIKIEPKHIDNKATFTIDLLNKTETTMQVQRKTLLRSMPSEDEIRDASIAVTNSGISRYDYNEVMNTATDMRAFTIAQEDKILESSPKRK